MLNKNYKNYADYFVIFDECHRLKNSTGVWGKAGYNLTKICRGFILLSATPIPNGWEDSINYFKMFGLTKNKTQFIRNNAITDMTHGYLEIKGWRNETKLMNMWKSISRRLNKSDATDLPPLIFDEVYFKPSPTYKQIKKNRVCNGVFYDNMMKLRHGLRLFTSLEQKIEYFVQFLLDTDENVVVFYNYEEELRLLLEKIDKTTYVCNGHQKDYPKKEEWDKIRNTVTLANYKSGSEAVEFTYGTIIVYFSPTDSYTEFCQSYGRCYRNGQTKKVTAYKYITKDTIETDIYKALNNKKDFNYKLWETQLEEEMKK